jgi:hypothetical protein
VLVAARHLAAAALAAGAALSAPAGRRDLTP